MLLAVIQNLSGKLLLALSEVGDSTGELFLSIQAEAREKAHCWEDRDLAQLCLGCSGAVMHT